jgi:hypothetical protein
LVATCCLLIIIMITILTTSGLHLNVEPVRGRQFDVRAHADRAAALTIAQVTFIEFVNHNHNHNEQ